MGSRSGPPGVVPSRGTLDVNNWARGIPRLLWGGREPNLNLRRRRSVIGEGDDPEEVHGHTRTAVSQVDGTSAKRARFSTAGTY